jgi:hypothetical protein
MIIKLELKFINENTNELFCINKNNCLTSIHTVLLKINNYGLTSYWYLDEEIINTFYGGLNNCLLFIKSFECVKYIIILNICFDISKLYNGNLVEHYKYIDDMLCSFY